MKIENKTLLIQRGNSYCIRKSSAKDLGLNLIWRTITTNWHTNTVTHQSTNRGSCYLTRMSQAVDCSSMPIITCLFCFQFYIQDLPRVLIFYISYVLIIAQFCLYAFFADLPHNYMPGVSF